MSNSINPELRETFLDLDCLGELCPNFNSLGPECVGALADENDLTSHLTCGFTEETWKKFRREGQYLRGDDPRILAIDTCTKEKLVEIYSRNRAEQTS